MSPEWLVLQPSFKKSANQPLSAKRLFGVRSASAEQSVRGGSIIADHTFGARRSAAVKQLVDDTAICFDL